MNDHDTRTRRSFRLPAGGRVAAALSIAVSATMVLPGPGTAPAGAIPASTFERVSIRSDGTEASLASRMPSMSTDGRYVAFTSDARLDAQDTNDHSDVYVRDRLSDTTTLVSAGKNGVGADGPSSDPAISADGRHVAFTSWATDLVPTWADVNGKSDVLIRDLHTKTTDFVSYGSGLAGLGNNNSFGPAISADGRYVAFSSEATNLGAVDNIGWTDVFLRDRQAAKTTLVSVPGKDNGNSTRPSISADGSVIAFQSTAAIHNGDTNGKSDIYIRNVTTNVMQRVVPLLAESDGHSTAASLSADGQWVAFESAATNLVGGGKDTNGFTDVFVKRLGSVAITRVNAATDGSQPEGNATLEPRISADGAWVAYVTRAKNAVSSEAATVVGEVQIRDRAGQGMPIPISVGPNGSANGQTFGPAVSGDGRYVAFTTAGNNLIDGDTNGGKYDVYVRTALPSAVSVSPALMRSGGQRTVTVHGSGFTATPRATVTGDGVGVTAVNWVSPTALTVTLHVNSDASPGKRTVVVKNPAGDVAACVDCLTVVTGYWMVGSDGKVFPFGDAAHLGDPSPSAHPVVDLEPTPAGDGYWVVDNVGHVFGYNAKHLGNADLAKLSPGEKVTSLSATPSGAGYWLFTSRGRVLTFGDAVHDGDMSATVLNGPVLDSIPTPSGHGYYMVGSDGGVFAFGDAVFRGSMGATRLNAAVQSLVPDPDGTGYWLVASDGGIFAFEAVFRGSMGGTRLNKPVTGMVTNADGYLMVAEDGGIFNFSDRPFYGSLGNNPPPHPITSVAAL